MCFPSLMHFLCWCITFQALALSVHAQVAASPDLTLKRQISLEKATGGSVVTALRFGIAVNKGSSLHRRWHVLNDNTCPVVLGQVGIRPVYESERHSGSYSFVAQGEAKAASDIVAYELLFPLFDVWGDRLSNLAMLKVADVKAGDSIPLEGTWYASENNVREYFTAVAFVDKVMTSDGKIWRADRRAIAEKLSEVQIKVSESGLDRDPPKEPKK